ncbi:hypothetical protein ACJX0J_041860, partial [Zea mays]
HADVARPGQDAVGEDGVGAGHGPGHRHGGHQRRPATGRPRARARARAHRRAPLPQGRPRHVRRRRPRHRRRRLPGRRARRRLRVPHRLRPLPLLQQRRLPPRGRLQARPDALAGAATLVATKRRTEGDTTEDPGQEAEQAHAGGLEFASGVYGEL